MNREELESKKEMILQFISSKEYRPMNAKEMAIVLQVPAKDKKVFKSVIEELITEGKVHADLKGKIKPLADNVCTGTFMATRKGFGFVRVEGMEDDIFISAHKTKGALDGDKVQIVLDTHSHGKRQEGEVISILERGNTILVGTYSSSKSYGFVVADNHKFTKDIYIAKSDTKGAITGHKVVVEITDFGNEDRNPEGRIVEIIGHINDPGVDILSVIKAYGLPEEYPDEVMDQVEGIESEVAEEEKAGRRDYRDLQTVTIDGEDAKDLDDAITLTKENGVYHLGVHIADVSQYVTEKSALDKEALKRGTSVYLVDRVIPMLPHKLSNGICSLNEGVDRLTLSCMMEINADGKIIKHSIEESVINVTRRMSYTSVHKIVEEHDEQECQEYHDLIPMFELMYELADILEKNRKKSGSINFDFPESKITLDEKGKPLDVQIYERTRAHHIIEEFMLAANRTVAEEYFWQELPFVYRVHETPDVEKINELNTFVENFGYVLKTNQDGEIHPKEIQKLMTEVAETPEEALISRLALRSMKQARYTTSCEGHFGLAMKYYCHFTSPIRRYPDLQIHRIIKENIHGKLSDKRISHYNRILPDVTTQTSLLERRADDAEREVEKMKKAEYMEQFVGQTFEGVISGVTSWGMYVELPNTIEGMIRVADIPGDYYYFEEERYQMVGEHTHKIFKLGQKIRVTVSGVDKILRNIDFEIAQDEDETEGANTETRQDAALDHNDNQTDAVTKSTKKADSKAQKSVAKEKAKKQKNSTKAKKTKTAQPSKEEAQSGYRAKAKARKLARKMAKAEAATNSKKGKNNRNKKKKQAAKTISAAQKQAIEKAFAKKIAEKKKRAMIEKEADRLVSHAKSNAKKKSHAKAMGKAGIKAKNARSGAGMSTRRK